MKKLLWLVPLAILMQFIGAGGALIVFGLGYAAYRLYTRDRTGKHHPNPNGIPLGK